MAAIPPQNLGTTQISWQPLGKAMHTWLSGQDFVQLHFASSVSSGSADAAANDMARAAEWESFMADGGRTGRKDVLSSGGP